MLYPKFKKQNLIRCLFCIAVASFCLSDQALAGGYFLRMGPASSGTGGPNPLGIPPAVSDLELSFISNGGMEFNLGLPGIFCGARSSRPWGGYASFGGGAVIDGNGVGPGIYAAFGQDFGWDTIKFNIEYKQALGLSTQALLSPYAVRIGVGLWFK